MNIEEIREYCLSKPGVTESFPFNDTALVLKVVKMFALLDLSEDSRGISLKCDPELAIELREQHPEVTPAWHFNKIIMELFYTVRAYPPGLSKRSISLSFSFLNFFFDQSLFQRGF